MSRRHGQPQPNGAEHARERGQRRVALLGQRLEQRLLAQLGAAGDLGHAVRAGDLSQRQQQRSLIARLEHRVDVLGGVGFTDFLVQVFSNDISPVRHARGLGLLALEMCPPLKNFVARRMMFGARG